MGNLKGIKKVGQDTSGILEERIQSDCYIWFHNSYPELRGLLCYNLNNSKNAIDGNRNKAMGLQAGRSDMVLYYHSKAIMIEFKTEKGLQRPIQKEWQTKVENQGFEYHIVRNKDQFIKLIKQITEI